MRRAGARDSTSRDAAAPAAPPWVISPRRTRRFASSPSSVEALAPRTEDAARRYGQRTGARERVHTPISRFCPTGRRHLALRGAGQDLAEARRPPRGRAPALGGP